MPQYLLEDAAEAGIGGRCSVVCTQPRRIAATSVAARVAEERGEAPPGRPSSTVTSFPWPLPELSASNIILGYKVGIFDQLGVYTKQYYIWDARIAQYTTRGTRERVRLPELCALALAFIVEAKTYEGISCGWMHCWHQRV